RASGGTEAPGGWSTREVEVLRWTARGLTNREIAAPPADGEAEHELRLLDRPRARRSDGCGLRRHLDVLAQLGEEGAYLGDVREAVGCARGADADADGNAVLRQGREHVLVRLVIADGDDVGVRGGIGER